MPTPVGVAVIHPSAGPVATIAEAVAENTERTRARVRAERVVKSTRAIKTGPAAGS